MRVRVHPLHIISLHLYKNFHSMKIKYISFLLIAVLFTTLTASAQSWLWGVEGITGLKADLFARNVATNSTGNVYHTGGFETSLTFGTYNLTSAGIDDVYLVKYDQNGNVQWATQSKSPPGSKTFARSVATDDSDNSYITGYTGDTTVFGTDTLRKKSQGFLVKYNANGKLMWVKQPGFNTFQNGGYAVTTDNSGHEYLTGAGAYLIKFDRNGNIIWTILPTTHYFGNDSINNAGFSVATDGYGNVYVSGEFSDSLTFGNYHLYSANVGAFIAKFDSNGNALWAQQSTNTPSTVQNFNTQNPVYALAVDRSGAAYLTSAFADSITFGSYTFTSLNASFSNFFVLKFNPGGTIAWGEQATPLSGSSYGWGTYSICTDDSNHIYISGAKGQVGGQLTASFVFANDTFSIISNAYDAPSFLFKLDSSGYLLCGSTLQSGGFEANAVTSDSTGKFVYLGGGFNYPFVVGHDSLTVKQPGFVPYVARWQSCAKCDLALTTSPQSLSVCYGHNITLKASGGTNYSWSPSTGLNATTGDSVIATTSTTTTYTVTSTGGNCNHATAQIVVTIIPSPNKPTFRQDGDTLISSAKYDNQWYRNDTLLLNDTTQYLIITILGEYRVNVLNEANGCSTSSDSIDITTLTGINQLSMNSYQLSVFPNPTSGKVFITLNSSVADIKDWNLQLTDVLGRTLYTMPSLNYTNEIDLSNLSNGLYFLTVINKTGRMVVPVVKQN